jgi:cell division protein FtsB
MLGLCGSLAYAAVMGKGGWLRCQDLRHQWQAQQATNQALSKKNETLRAEVRDLKSGSEAVEEIARSELGMVRPNEIYYQYWPTKSIPPHSAH